MEILKISRKDQGKIIGKALRSLRREDVFICPTDTVYGLIGSAESNQAVSKVFKIKKRLKSKSIPIFVKDIKTAKKLAFVNKKQEIFLKRVWPGRVTVILKRKDKKLPRILFGQKKTIALRIPNYKLINILLERIREPLIGTSANISGKPASTKIKDIIKQFEKENFQPDLVLDAGNLAKNKPSRVIDLTDKEPKIRRY